jgi:hypothetical protein
MPKVFFAIVAAAFTSIAVSTSDAYSGSYPFGDEPYRLNWWNDPEIQTGCWKWNWQQYQWNDYCAVYIHPKAYMYPHSRRGVLRTSR